MMNPAPYCGDLALAFDLRPKRDAAGGVLPLFAGRRASYSFNTRVAIRKAVDLLGLKPGDEVLAPAYNCGSELDPLRHAGLSIRLYPITAATEIDPNQLESMIGPLTRAIYLTHYFGFLQPETAAIRKLCDGHGLLLIEDCALSLLSGDAPAEGRAGDISVFCFYKFFPVLAGGALVINSEKIATDVSFARPAPRKVVGKGLLRAGLSAALGPAGAAGLLRKVKGDRDADLSQETQEHLQPDMPGHYYFDPRLTDARMSTFTMRELAGFDVAATIAARRANYLRLLDGMVGVPDLAPIYPELPASAVPLSMPVRVTTSDGKVAQARRNALVRALQAEGIAATSWWAGYCRHLDFSDKPGVDLATARRLKDTVFSLPTHQNLGQIEIDHIAECVRRCFQDLDRD
jgi:dTDP-4-amino-4,6-dideoxygalactose transaminase